MTKIEASLIHTNQSHLSFKDKLDNPLMSEYIFVLVSNNKIKIDPKA